jgi:hypothetical protein
MDDESKYSFQWKELHLPQFWLQFGPCPSRNWANLKRYNTKSAQNAYLQGDSSTTPQKNLSMIRKYKNNQAPGEWRLIWVYTKEFKESDILKIVTWKNESRVMEERTASSKKQSVVGYWVSSMNSAFSKRPSKCNIRNSLSMWGITWLLLGYHKKME